MHKVIKKELEEFKLLQDDMISGKNYYILKQKIEDLDKNSVSVHGEPFSTMFE